MTLFLRSGFLICGYFTLALALALMRARLRTLSRSLVHARALSLVLAPAHSPSLSRVRSLCSVSLSPLYPLLSHHVDVSALSHMCSVKIKASPVCKNAVVFLQVRGEFFFDRPCSCKFVTPFLFEEKKVSRMRLHTHESCRTFERVTSHVRSRHVGVWVCGCVGLRVCCTCVIARFDL